MRWQTALTGLMLSVFALVALSGPGRIDIVDGQARYEVARSLVEHGDLVIRDPNVWFSALPGRDGRLYSNYRFPHSVAGVAAILAADTIGPVSESRRISSSLSSVPSRAQGWRSVMRSCSADWATNHGSHCSGLRVGSSAPRAGSTGPARSTIFSARCPSFWESPWPWPRADRRPLSGALVAGLTLGLAFNCKQPLGIFVLAVLAAIYDPAVGWRSQWGRLGIILATLLAAIAVYKGYEWYKFPPGSTAGHAELLKKYVPTWPGHPVTALLALTFSLGAGVFFYNGQKRG